MTEINNTATLYFECHVTIDPVQPGPRLELLEKLAESCAFRVAKLLMRKGQEIVPHGDDAFMTARSVHLEPLRFDLGQLVGLLRMNHYKVKRYKIEDTIVDSARADEYSLLT